MQQLCLKYAPKEQKVAFYNFDPYYNNVTYAKEHLRKRLMEEVAAYQRANTVFFAPEQAIDYSDAAFDDVR